MNSTIGYIADRPANVFPARPTYTGEYGKDVPLLQWAEYWYPRTTFDLKEWQVWQMNVGNQSMSNYEAWQGEFSDYQGHLGGNLVPMPNFAGV